MILDARELKRRQLLRLKGIEQGKPLIGPAVVQVHLTDRCNLSCRFCYYFAPGSPNVPIGPNTLSIKLFAKIVRDCVDLKVDWLNLSAKGEPSLHPRFYDLLRYAEKKPIAVSMNSNGAFPLNRCRDILRADRIVINIGESDRESYLKLQGQDFFLRVIKNIRELAKLKRTYNPVFQIVAVLIKTTLNAERLEKTTALLKKIGVDDVRSVTAEAWEYTQDIMLPESLSEPPPKEWLPCYHGWFYSSIKLDGHVNLCCFMQELKIDRVGDKSFKDVWASEAYAKARVAAVSGKGFENYVECKNCPIAFRNREFGAQLKAFQKMRV